MINLIALLNFIRDRLNAILKFDSICVGTANSTVCTMLKYFLSWSKVAISAICAIYSFSSVVVNFPPCCYHPQPHWARAACWPIPVSPGHAWDPSHFKLPPLPHKLPSWSQTHEPSNFFSRRKDWLLGAQDDDSHLFSLFHDSPENVCFADNCISVAYYDTVSVLISSAAWTALRPGNNGSNQRQLSQKWRYATLACKWNSAKAASKLVHK